MREIKKTCFMSCLLSIRNPKEVRDRMIMPILSRIVCCDNVCYKQTNKQTRNNRKYRKKSFRLIFWRETECNRTAAWTFSDFSVCFWSNLHFTLQKCAVITFIVASISKIIIKIHLFAPHAFLKLPDFLMP